MQAYLAPLLVALCGGLIAGFLLRRAPRAVSTGLSLAIAIGLGGITLWFTAGGSQPEQVDLASVPLDRLRPARPIQVSDAGYISSQSCRECHPHNHATWYASYHRRMTQVATPEAVAGDFDDVEVSFGQREYQLRRRGEICWVEMDDHDLPPGTSDRVDVPLVMTTGSHHMQVYWYPTGFSRVLGQMPLVYLMDEQRWIPRQAAFLVEPDVYHTETGRWNDTCIGCHATHGQPRPDSRGGWDSQVAEFGISCEACHGPAETHVALRRAGRDDPDPIVNPADLTHRRASQVCGQCHSVNVPLTMEEYRHSEQYGKAFRPGDDLFETRMIVREDQVSREHLKQAIPDVDQFMASQFWDDGMVRISGREYNGLSQSACYEQGTMSCLTCHRLHQAEDDPRSETEWANDQLRLGFESDRACVECHQGEEYGPDHTHHPTGSSGASCVNCHMPYTTYGLLKAIRSHQISVPNVSDDLRAGRPNACNGCHLDKTLAWSSQHLNEWHGHSLPELGDDQKSIAASLLALLRGDAGQRALAAWSMGWEAAHEASGSDWQAPFLAQVLEDPYDAVRFITYRSLKSLPGYADFAYDFVAAPEERSLAKQRALEQWTYEPPEGRESSQALLIDEDGRPGPDLGRLLKQRDDRPMNLAE